MKNRRISHKDFYLQGQVPHCYFPIRLVVLNSSIFVALALLLQCVDASFVKRAAFISGRPFGGPPRNCESIFRLQALIDGYPSLPAQHHSVTQVITLCSVNILWWRASILGKRQLYSWSANVCCNLCFQPLLPTMLSSGGDCISHLLHFERKIFLWGYLSEEFATAVAAQLLAVKGDYLRNSSGGAGFQRKSLTTTSSKLIPLKEKPSVEILINCRGGSLNAGGLLVCSKHSCRYHVPLICDVPIWWLNGISRAVIRSSVCLPSRIWPLSSNFE